MASLAITLREREILVLANGSAVVMVKEREILVGTANLVPGSNSAAMIRKLGISLVPGGSSVTVIKTQMERWEEAGLLEKMILPAIFKLRV